jgi:hypothetical protein
MSSIRNQIIDAVALVLNGANKPAGVNVRRFSLAKIEPSHLPLIEVYPGSDVVKDQSKGRQSLIRTLGLILDVYGMGDPVDVALDEAVCWITTALQADQSLGGLCLDIREKSAEWDAEMAAQGTGLCKVLVEIDYIHNRLNQEVKP